MSWRGLCSWCCQLAVVLHATHPLRGRGLMTQAVQSFFHVLDSKSWLEMKYTVLVAGLLMKHRKLSCACQPCHFRGPRVWLETSTLLSQVLIVANFIQSFSVMTGTLSLGLLETQNLSSSCLHVSEWQYSAKYELWEMGSFPAISPKGTPL